MVVDTSTWTIKKEIQGHRAGHADAGRNLRQKIRDRRLERLASGIAFIDAATDELVGIHSIDSSRRRVSTQPRLGANICSARLGGGIARREELNANRRGGGFNTKEMSTV
jgi:hypothetical protein